MNKLLILLITIGCISFTTPNKKILFVGDSITTIEHKGIVIKSNYPYLIKRELQPKGIGVDVVAIGGKRTKWMLDNLIVKLKTNKYDRVYIYGGINDMFSGVSEKAALNNIQKMVDVVNKSGSDAFVIVGYDAKYFMDSDKLRRTPYVPTKLGMIALKDKYIRYQNLIPITIKNATIIKKFNISSKLTKDGIHPTGRGQRIIATNILKTINN